MISLIAAIAENNCIGKNGTLPWHLPEDLKHFKEITSGKVVVMGRKTWESLPEKFRPLPNRVNVVISSQKNYTVPEGVEVYTAIQDAYEAHKHEEVIIIGGAQIYAQTIDIADRLYITHIHQSVDGDAFFPVIDMTMWKETDRDDQEGFCFVTYLRKNTSLPL